MGREQNESRGPEISRYSLTYAYSPATIGMRAARMAGNRPPIRPTVRASSTPWPISAG
jgi:hypothetical protein